MPAPATNHNPRPSSSQSPARKVKFVASDPDRGGLPVKRKHTLQACSTCRLRKRRCTHNKHLNASQATAAVRDHSPATSDTLATPQEEPKLHGTSHFICDSNPATLFLEATMEGSAAATPPRRDVGVWVPSNTTGDPTNISQFKMSRPPAIIDHFFTPFVREHCLTTLPDDADFVHLKALYTAKIHPLFPALPLSALDGSLLEPANVLIRQLVSLAAAADPDAAPYLRLKNKGPDLLSAREYSEALASSVRATMETSLITDRVLHIRALVMLSLYAQPTCADDTDLPVQFSSRAVHHIFALGMHHSFSDGPDTNDLETLLCCVWALDRINAAVHGCPSFMHERDMSAGLGRSFRKQPACFRLFLSVVQWLDQILDLYRPESRRKDAELESTTVINVPDFETMVIDEDALAVPAPLLATIETFHHAVIILSCKQRPSTSSSTTPSNTLSPGAKARQSLAAERISCSMAREHLSSIQFVPYAASLALSVEYHKMRHSYLPLMRARAMASFKRISQMLQQYREYFWGANTIATMAESVLREVEKAANTLTRVAAPENDDSDGILTKPNRHTIEYPNPAPISSSTATAVFDADMDAMIDLSLFTTLGEDIFNCIDPNFNLQAVDNALAANLEIGIPINWSDMNPSLP